MGNERRGRSAAHATLRTTRMGSAFLALILLALGAPLHVVGQAPGTDGTDAAREAAEAWLVFIDSDEYEQSWAAAATTFRAAVTAEAWTERAVAASSQLGARNGDRGFVETERSTDPPGAPPGDYVSVTYTSSFTGLDPAREVVSLVLEDGEWKVVGYFIVPE